MQHGRNGALPAASIASCSADRSTIDPAFEGSGPLRLPDARIGYPQRRWRIVQCAPCADGSTHDGSVNTAPERRPTCSRRPPSALAELEEPTFGPLAPTSRTVIGHIGVDRVGTGLEIVSVRSLVGSLDPLLFRLELLTLGP